MPCAETRDGEGFDGEDGTTKRVTRFNSLVEFSSEDARSFGGSTDKMTNKSAGREINFDECAGSSGASRAFPGTRSMKRPNNTVTAQRV